MGKPKGTRYVSDYSFILEEKLDVPYLVLGYPDWLESSVPAHLKKIQREIRAGREAQDLVPHLTNLWKRPVLGLDLENGGPKERDGLDPISSTSHCLLGQFGNRDGILVVQPELIPFFREPLESTSILKLNQNIEYDYKWFLKKYSIHIVRMYCTMLSEQLLRAGLDGYGVGLLDLVRYHACRLISKEVRNQFIGHSGVFTEEQLYYAARDVWLLFDIFDSQNDEIRELGLEAVALDEFRCIPATAEMELTGVFLDTGILSLSMDYYNREEIRLKQEIKRIWNGELTRLGKKAKADGFFDDLFGSEDVEIEEEFDMDSAEQKLEALRRIGLTLPNVQRSTLKQVEHQLTGLMVEYSVVQKINSTYGQRLINMIHADDRRLHPEFKQLGMGDAQSAGNRDKKATIATGRFSSDFQQLPRPKEIYELVSDPGEVSVVETVLGSRLGDARRKMAEQLAKEQENKWQASLKQ